MERILFILLFLIISIVWLSYEAWRAPLLDDNYKVIQEEKTFRDLLKKLKIWK
jgi:hypothetical protein